MSIYILKIVLGLFMIYYLGLSIYRLIRTFKIILKRQYRNIREEEDDVK